MKTPNQLMEFLHDLDPHEISYGCGGLRLFESGKLGEGQLGYSVGPKGESLCGSEEGTWRSSWMVIGYDTGLGDPIFIDTANPELPVFTAVAGEGAWNPKPVAISLGVFAQCWREFARISEGRSNPVEEEANPLQAPERSAYLERNRAISGWHISAEFWIDLLFYGEDEDE
jgi:hypothetical protein